MLAILKALPHALFSFQGRVSRAPYLMGAVLVTGASVLCTYLAQGSVSPDPFPHPAVELVAVTLAGVVDLALVTKRVRDIDWNVLSGILLVAFMYVPMFADPLGLWVAPNEAVQFSMGAASFTSLAIYFLIGLVPGKMQEAHAAVAA
jgi:uncharacterized membrane protein YhaH (DUF805 family)